MVVVSKILISVISVFFLCSMVQSEDEVSGNGYSCKFVPGAGTNFVRAGNSRTNCFDTCVEQKKTNDAITGVMIYKKNWRGCWCLTSSGRKKNDDTKSCVLKPATDDDSFQATTLGLHNKYRTERWGSEFNLQWDNDLASASARYAKVLAARGYMQHDNNRGDDIGENLWYSTWPQPNEAAYGKKAVEAWFREICNYDDCSFGGAVIAHFTTILWKTTTRLGCGFAENTYSEKKFVVCRYEPKGNWGSELEENVGCPWNPIIQALRAKEDCDAYRRRKWG